MIAPDPGQRGSVLVLMPAAVLVLVVLGAIAVDSAIVFLGQRELANATAAAANDAATEGLSEAAFYRDQGQLRFDERRAHQVASLAMESRRSRGLRDLGYEVRTGGRQVMVTARATVDYVFARGVPGMRRFAMVRATSTARAEGG